MRDPPQLYFTPEPLNTPTNIRTPGEFILSDPMMTISRINK